MTDEEETEFINETTEEICDWLASEKAKIKLAISRGLEKGLSEGRKEGYEKGKNNERELQCGKKNYEKEIKTLKSKVAAFECIKKTQSKMINKLSEQIEEMKRDASAAGNKETAEQRSLAWWDWLIKWVK